jgi:N-acetylmuramoyl-L-alanine amidase
MRAVTQRPAAAAVALVLLVALMSACSAPVSHTVPHGAQSAAGIAPMAMASPPPSPTRMPATALPAATPTTLPTVTPLPTATSPSAPLIAVDPGHGGRDLGAPHLNARGEMDYHESTVNLDLALLVRDALLRRGFRVLLVRDGDYMLNDGKEDTNGDGVLDYADDLQTRIDLVNAEGADLLLSIHQNAFYYRSGADSSDVGGVITYYCADRPFSDESLRFARLVQGALVTTFRDVLGHDIDDRGVEVDLALGAHLILLGPETERTARPSEMPGVLSETMFITHWREGVLARDPQALRALAQAYADAIQQYFAGAETSGGAP